MWSVHNLYRSVQLSIYANLLQFKQIWCKSVIVYVDLLRICHSLCRSVANLQQYEQICCRSVALYADLLQMLRYLTLSTLLIASDLLIFPWRALLRAIDTVSVIAETLDASRTSRSATADPLSRLSLDAPTPVSIRKACALHSMSRASSPN